LALVFGYDINHRVYLKSNSSPDYCSHWVEHKIFGENNRSWLAGNEFHPIKINKKNPTKSDFIIFSIEDLEKQVWDYNNRHHISQKISNKSKVSFDQLKQIAEIIGYQENNEN